MVNKIKKQKIWIVDHFRVRRHSRVLYLPLDSLIANIYDIEKGDVVKCMLVEVIRSPRADEEEKEAT